MPLPPTLTAEAFNTMRILQDNSVGMEKGKYFKGSGWFRCMSKSQNNAKKTIWFLSISADQTIIPMPHPSIRGGGAWEQITLQSEMTTVDFSLRPIVSVSNRGCQRQVLHPCQSPASPTSTESQISRGDRLYFCKFLTTAVALV